MDKHYEGLGFIKEFNSSRELPKKLAFRESYHYGSDILSKIASNARLAIRLTGEQDEVDYSAVKYLGKLLQDFSKPDPDGKYFPDSMNEAVDMWRIMKGHYKDSPLMMDSIQKPDGLAKAISEVSSRLVNIEKTHPEEPEGLALICDGIEYFARVASDSGRVKRIA